MTLTDEVSYFLSSKLLRDDERVYLAQTPIEAPYQAAINQQLDKINERLIRAKINLAETTLDLNESGITRLPPTLFQDNELRIYWEKLIKLDCSGNQLSSLDVSACPALTVLLCFDNYISSLTLSCPNLMRLNCSGNALTTLDLKLPALQSLSCYKNQLTTLHLASCNALKYLWCGYNQLEQLTLAHLELLQISCEHNALTQLDLRKCPALERVHCHDNKLTQLHVPIKLQILACYQNLLTELDLTCCHALTKIECDQALTEILSPKLPTFLTQSSDTVFTPSNAAIHPEFLNLYKLLRTKGMQSYMIMQCPEPLPPQERISLTN